MSLRLQITPPGEAAFSFEHPGPSVHVGRDPDAELTLDVQGQQGQGLDTSASGGPLRWEAAGEASRSRSV